jgi:MFS family permease
MPQPSSHIVTDIPARLDRLSWGRFHWLIVTALGATWILDGLEITLVGSLSGAIADPRALGLSSTRIGLTASAYLLGAVLGALVFGHLADRMGRRRLFNVTVSIYLVATLLSGLAWDFWSFAVFRFLVGTGIGGEYAAINSAVQEFIPARYRGRTDLAINGSWWLGAAAGAMASLVLLDRNLFGADVGWRLGFILGAALALIVLALRRFVPESPRWSMTHGRLADAERTMAEIERRNAVEPPRTALAVIRLRQGFQLSLGELARTLFVRYPRRVVLGLALMGAQAFCYNAIFFTYALILTKFYAIPNDRVGWFILPFAAGNFLGPLLLGPLFDIWGRKAMIGGTYALAGAAMAVVGYLFSVDALDATAQTAAWSAIFFFASAGASAAYLTVGESFPLEMRASSIALFYAIGTGLGGVFGPMVFGALIDTGSRSDILWGYLFGGGLMLVAAAVEFAIGIRAERRALEEVALPLSGADEPQALTGA